MWNVWWRREIQTGFWCGNLKNHLEDLLGVARRMVLILEAYAVTKFNETFSG
jgi:hypothetical protein